MLDANKQLSVETILQYIPFFKCEEGKTESSITVQYPFRKLKSQERYMC
jgi:hypothetical protein